MKSKNIIEIPDNVVTAFVTMRQKDGTIASGVAKGEPHYTESLALAFGTFVAVVNAIEALEGPEVELLQDLRKMIQNESLEDARCTMSQIAAATRQFLDDQEGRIIE